MSFLQKLKYFLRPYWKQVTLATLALLATTTTDLLIPNIIRQVIDVGVIQKQMNYLIFASLLILTIGVTRAFILFWQRYLSVWVAQKIAYDLRNKLYDHIQRLSFSYHDRTQTGQLISRCIEDVNSTNQFLGMGITELVRIVILIIGITTLLLIENAKLTTIAILPMIPLLLITIKFGQRISGLFYKVDQALGELSARLQENVSGVNVVRAFSRENYEIKRFEKANKELYDTRIDVFAEFAKIFPTTNLLVIIGTILILWFGGQMVINGEMTVGELVSFNAYLLLMAQPAQQLTWTVNLAGEAVAGMNRIYEVLDHNTSIIQYKNPKPLGHITGNLSFKNVYFRYEKASEYALKDINIEVKANQIVALIGPTGSGKTSIINLIPKFYDATDGEIFIDNTNIKDLDLVSYRRQIGIVLQTSLLFSDTVAENIAFGKPEATDNEIISAAKAAQAHEFIQELSEGYNTIIGERGITLSGGQRQRIAIARALLINPRILILDDSTSSVDTETEYLIQKALDRLMEGRTTFVIAHRLSTVRRADLILVMENGQIKDRGNHQDLLSRDGIYKDIYHLQLKGQEELYNRKTTIESQKTL